MTVYAPTGTAEIRLANGKGIVLIDVGDLPLIGCVKWYRHALGYAACRKGLFESTLMHRIIMRAPSTCEVDHINHDKLDCRKVNLRLVTRSQNNQNKQGPSRNNRLGLRGVSAQYNKGGSVSYFARVQINGEHFYKCGFKTPQEAARAAVELRRAHFTHSKECV